MSHFLDIPISPSIVIISDLGLGKMVSTSRGYSGNIYIKVLTLLVWQTSNANPLKTCLSWVNHRRVYYCQALCFPSVLILLHLHKRGPALKHSSAWAEFSFSYKSVGVEGCIHLQIISGSGCGGACTLRNMLVVVSHKTGYSEGGKSWYL